MPSLITTYTCPPNVWTRIDEGVSIWIRTEQRETLKLHLGQLANEADTYAPASDTDQFMIVEDYQRDVSFGFDDAGLTRFWVMPMGADPVKIIVAAFP